MLAKTFIFESLKKLSSDFPAVEIRYRYNRSAETHLVELTPLKSYYKDIKLENAWINITKEFMDRFPLEDISFVSSDSILHIEDPEFSFNKPVIWSHAITSHQFGWPELWRKTADEFISKVEFQHVFLPSKLIHTLAWEEPKIWDTLDSFHYHYHSFISYNAFFNLTEDWPFSTPFLKPLANPTVSKESSLAMAA